MENVNPSQPSRAHLYDSLKRLQDVSTSIEALLNRVRHGPELDEAERAQLESLAALQGTILEEFVTLSEDRSGLTLYQEAERAFQKNLNDLQKAEDPAVLPHLREQVSACIEEWVVSLEQIIRGVLMKAP